MMANLTLNIFTIHQYSDLLTANRAQLLYLRLDMHSLSF